MASQYNRFLNKSLAASARCQRNYDHSKAISSEDVETLLTALKSAPSKQNCTYFQASYTLDRDVIDEVYGACKAKVTLGPDEKHKDQSQVLGNMLIAFFADDKETDQFRTADYHTNFEKNKNIALGTVAGYLKVTAELLGLKSGCCCCFDEEKIKELFKTDKEPLLLMGIGYEDEDRPRTEHHVHGHKVRPFYKDVVVENV